MNKKEKALRRALVSEVLKTDEGVDAVIELLDTVLAHRNHPDPINDDDGREAITESVDELVTVLGYDNDEDEDDEESEDEES